MSSSIDADVVLSELAEHRAEIQKLGVRKLALFGSAARNTAGPESDVDLLVEFEGTATFDRYVDLEDCLQSLLGRKVDLVTTDSLRTHVRESLERELRYVPGF